MNTIERMRNAKSYAADRARLANEELQAAFDERARVEQRIATAFSDLIRFGIASTSPVIGTDIFCVSPAQTSADNFPSARSGGQMDSLR